MSIKKIFLAFTMAICSLTLAAQILHPAKWSTSVSANQAKVGDELTLIYKVTIDKDWYLYSSEFDCEDGPFETAFTFTQHPSFKLLGKVEPIGAIDKHDDIFECDLKIFKKTAEFRQKVKILSSDIKIEGEYEYQVCTDVDGKCIPFNEEFSFNGTNIKVSGDVGPNNPKQKDEGNDQTLHVIDTSTIFKQTLSKNYGKRTGPILDKSILDGESSIHEESFLGYLIFAFLLGLTSLITPCVFPMIPMTVTFFLKDNQSRRQGIRKALVFGFSIVLIYTLAGTLFALLLGAEGLNALATHWAPNLFVFIIFIVFALSFLGLFEINAPYQLVNKVDQQAEKGGWIGIFFMASTLVLVSFSCTIPIVGNVVVMAAGGQVIKPVLAMFFYALAFAIPFTLFAVFPEWIKSLPKSGGWLNSVKVTLGFLELALSLKFLSIADQAYHWGLLDRDVNLAIWIVIFTILGVYFLGNLRMSGDSPVEKVTVPRLLLATVTFSFVVYLIPGMWGAPLKSLAGYLPPLYTHDFDLISLARNDSEKTVCEEPKYSDFLHLPHGLQGYFDYDQALACARKQNKPLFIDFTGHGCTNCREMEAVVWSDPQVLDRLQKDFIIVALYVDDKTELPEAQWYTSTYDGKVKKSIGKQNADIQITNLENNAQPFYVLVGNDEKVLAWPYGYNRGAESFVEFLDKGKQKYKELYQSR
ncbi:MAG: thioredoxin family protein [Bacteroidia bacterium]|nr:thioredoxin family protein [Bacteroidia bacterium]